MELENNYLTRANPYKSSIRRGKKTNCSGIPSSEAETNLAGVLFLGWIQKSRWIKVHGIRVDFWIVQHEPGKKKKNFKKISFNSLNFILVCRNLPNIGDYQGTFWYQVAIMYIIFCHTMGQS